MQALESQKKVLQSTWTADVHTVALLSLAFFSELQDSHFFFRASLNNQEGCHMQSKAGIRGGSQC
jgi:hypothetical protein